MTEARQQLYHCKNMQRVVVVNRIYQVHHQKSRELVFEQCSAAATCPKVAQCAL